MTTQSYTPRPEKSHIDRLIEDLGKERKDEPFDDYVNRLQTALDQFLSDETLDKIAEYQKRHIVLYIDTDGATVLFGMDDEAFDVNRVEWIDLVMNFMADCDLDDMPILAAQFDRFARIIRLAHEAIQQSGRRADGVAVATQAESSPPGTEGKQ